MENKNSKNSFVGQEFYIGIDVHKKSWTVTIISCGIELKTMTMPPSGEQLGNYLKGKYPGGIYKSVYEAGFSGFWVHRELEKQGIKNIVVNPADVPTRYNERTRKSDAVDSRKLARELSNGKSLRGIYIPGEKEEALRELNRQREMTTKDLARVKNRIKSLLFLHNVEFEEGDESRHWSKVYIENLKGKKFEYGETRRLLDRHIEELEKIREIKGKVLLDIRKSLRGEERSRKLLEILQSVPGIGGITAMTLVTEIIDIKRFSSFTKLCSYVGLSPATAASGEREIVLGISYQQNNYLRHLMIESAWKAVAKDPEMTRCYNKWVGRMKKQRAIIKVARKLLSRIMYVWRHDSPYRMSYVG